MLFELSGGIVGLESTKVEILLCYLSIYDCQDRMAIYKSRNFIMLFEISPHYLYNTSTKVEILLCYLRIERKRIH